MTVSLGSSNMVRKCLESWELSVRGNFFLISSPVLGFIDLNIVSKIITKVKYEEVDEATTLIFREIYEREHRTFTTKGLIIFLFLTQLIKRVITSVYTLTETIRDRCFFVN